jgi:hypothetical protein
VEIASVASNWPITTSCEFSSTKVLAEKNIEELVDILDLLDRYDIKGTFFIELTNKNIELYIDYKIISYLKNHELGLHIHWGNMESYKKGLSKIPKKTMQYELENSLAFSKKLGFEPLSFRGGGLCNTNESLNLISDFGFKIDSSVAAKLNEADGWFQGHINVPYRSWYYPLKESYDIPASNHEEALGILEVPVTRMIPSRREWFPYTLTPQSPLFKFIVYEWIIKSVWEPITVITPIFHSWGEGKLRGKRFPIFLNKLEQLLEFLSRIKKSRFMRLINFWEYLGTLQPKLGGRNLA